MIDPLSTNGSISPTVQEFILNDNNYNNTEESESKLNIYSPAPPLSLRPESQNQLMLELQNRTKKH